jgi:hypothetical protein
LIYITIMAMDLVGIEKKPMSTPRAVLVVHMVL